MNSDAQEPSFFEVIQKGHKCFIARTENIEREKLISDVSENLAKAISNLNTLNRKIEANVTVGSDFNTASVLWKKYERAMAQSSDDSLPNHAEQSDTAANPTGLPLGNEDMSFGLAPGAGSTSYLGR